MIHYLVQNEIIHYILSWILLIMFPISLISLALLYIVPVINLYEKCDRKFEYILRLIGFSMFLEITIMVVKLTSESLGFFI